MARWTLQHEELCYKLVISLGHTGRCYGVFYAATDESVQRRARYKALNGNRTLRLFRVNAPGSIVGALLALKLSLARC